MTTAQKILISVVAAVMLLLLMIFAARVGGIAIRPTFVDNSSVQLTFSSPALRGAQVMVRWSASEVTSTPILVLFRDSAGEEVLARANTADTSARVTFPCESQTNSGSVVIIDQTTQRVLAQKTVDLLPPGADCILSH